MILCNFHFNYLYTFVELIEIATIDQHDPGIDNPQEPPEQQMMM